MAPQDNQGIFVTLCTLDYAANLRHLRTARAPSILAVTNQFPHHICGKRCRVQDLCSRTSTRHSIRGGQSYRLISSAFLNALAHKCREMYGASLHLGPRANPRLGYLLDLFGIGTHAELQSLRSALTGTYVPLDPSLPSEGSHAAKWRLQLNIPADELLAVRST